MRHNVQLFRNDPDNGVYGDCWRTALSCLLDLRPESVPHLNGAEVTGVEQELKTREWLAGLGLTLISVEFLGSTPLEQLLPMLVWTVGPGVNFMVSGMSPRGTYHVVIANTEGLVHDPHPDGGFLVGPSSDNLWRVCFIGRRV